MKTSESAAYSYTDEERTVAQDQSSSQLHTTLPIEELIHLFANELSDIVDYDSFEYALAEKELQLFHGSLQPHTCQYKIKDSGFDLGIVTLTRDEPFKEEEMLVVERALGALSVHLNNAIEDQTNLGNG